jgi:hypothetical protein
MKNPDARPRVDSPATFGLRRYAFLSSLLLAMACWGATDGGGIALALGTEKRDIDLRETGEGWEITVTGKDPWIFTADFPAGTRLAENSVFALEYQASDPVGWIFYARPEAGFSISPGYTSATHAWAPYALPLRAWDTGENRALTCTRLRIGFAGPVGKVVKLRSLALRAPTPGELRMEEALKAKRAAEKPDEVYIANDRIKLGVDLNMGGTITYLSPAGRDGNVINIHDKGREIQQSYYAGPQPFGKAHPAWKNWPWNPIGAGDVYGNRARVVEKRIGRNELYVKTIPLQWALENVPGECFFETWIRLEEDSAVVRCRLTNFRPDKNQYEAKEQEVPALYTIGKLWRLVSYTNDAPFTGGETTEIATERISNEFIWKRISPSESWAALVADDGRALGLILPGCIRWLGGFSGPRNVGGPKDGSTGYLSPLYREILDHNIVYEYTYTLVLGTVEAVREKATKLRAPPGVRAVFKADRQHWCYERATDQGWPIPDRLIIAATNEKSTMVSPQMIFLKRELPQIHVKALHRLAAGEGRRLELTWVPGREGRSEQAPIAQNVISDGKPHVYTFDLKAAAWSEGPGTLKLRLCAGAGAAATDRVEVFSATGPDRPE